jgi:penicillin amidase
MEKAPAIYQMWVENLEKEVWGDDLDVANKPVVMPDKATLVKCLSLSNFKFADNITTQPVETVRDVVTAAFKKAVPVVSRADADASLNWGKFKDAGVRHLLRLAPLSRFHLETGGSEHTINATRQYHGPSWRMIVELTDTTEAWGVYPGGQSGNPGSRYYDNFVEDWAAGRYHKLWVMREKDVRDKNILFTINFIN